MDNTKNIKKTIIICLLFILIAGLIVVLNKVKDTKTSNYGVSSIDKYNSNEYLNILMTDQDVAEIYLNDYINNINTNNYEEAYNSLNELYRIKKFGNINEFKEYLKDKDYSNVSMLKYSKLFLNNHAIYYCYDKQGNKYIFKENSIMNYEVYLDEDTVEIK